MLVVRGRVAKWNIGGIVLKFLVASVMFLWVYVSRGFLGDALCPGDSTHAIHRSPLRLLLQDGHVLVRRGLVIGSGSQTSLEVMSN